MYLKWFGHLGTLGSLIGIIFLIKGNENPSAFLMGFLICLAIILFILAIVWEMRLSQKNKGIYCKNEKEINEYMFRWINKGGRVTIFTRDMSWAEDDIVIKDMLLKKAMKNELTIILAKNKGLTKNLEQNGANIYTYGELGYTPNSRFTIVRTGRIDSKVAIGKEQNGKHFIEEFSSADGYQFHIANDLVNFLMKNNQVNKRKVNQNATS